VNCWCKERTPVLAGPSFFFPSSSCAAVYGCPAHNLPTVVRKSCIGAGFCRDSFQPLPVFKGSGADVWTRMGTAARAGCTRIRRQSSWPSITGIIQSVMTGSGTRCLMHSSACAPVRGATHVIAFTGQNQMPRRKKIGLIVDEQNGIHVRIYLDLFFRDLFRHSTQDLFQSLDERTMTGAVGSGAGPDGAGAVGRFTRACRFAALPGNFF
jgi:hypothetical protein